MAENFSGAEQGLIAVSVGNQSAGSSVKLADSNGDVIAEVTPGLDYAVVYVSTEDMTKGETYTLTAGSYSESITLTDNLYSTLGGGMQGSFGGGGPRGGMNEDAGGPQGGNGFGGPQGGGPQGGPDDMHGSIDGMTGATQLQGSNPSPLSGDTAA